jgi:hypothetical protein
MKTILFFFIATIMLTSCFGFGPAEATYDNLNYESITGEKGTVKVKFGDSTIIYEHAIIVYSEADVTTMLIKTTENKYIYIQGPAIVELDKLDATP